MELQAEFLQAKPSSHSKINLLPLIDVMFLLISFFLVTSIHMVLQQGIQVDLSPAETAEALKKLDRSTLSIDADGAFYLNKDLLSSTALSTVLRTLAEKNKEHIITIEADKQSHHGALIEALDRIRQAGLHNVVFSVEKKEPV